MFEYSVTLSKGTFNGAQLQQKVSKLLPQFLCSFSLQLYYYDDLLKAQAYNKLKRSCNIFVKPSCLAVGRNAVLLASSCYTLLSIEWLEQEGSLHSDAVNISVSHCPFHNDHYLD